MKISSLKINPDNPQTIKDREYSMLRYKILAYPNILKSRGIVYDSSDGKKVLGGNKRFSILKEISRYSEKKLLSEIEESKKYFEGNQDISFGIFNELRASKNVPPEWIFDCAEWSDEEKKAFIIVDNVNDGEWDLTKLKEQWDLDSLKNWGVIEWEESKEDSLNYLQSSRETTDFSDKNKEIDIDNLDDTCTLKLKYDSDVYEDVKEKLNEFSLKWDCDSSNVVLRMLKEWK